MFKKVGCLLILVLLPACASITKGTDNGIVVNTEPVDHAKCTLSNNKGEWHIDTPQSITVHASYQPLTIVCQRLSYKGSLVVESVTDGLTFGNILFGGPIGAGIDMANGSAYNYPRNIMVIMSK